MSELRSVVQDNDKLQSKIKTRILRLVDGMYVRLHPIIVRYINNFSRFLPAQLYINSLTDKFTEKEINTALDNMTKGKEGLDKAYDDTVDRILNQEQGTRELAIFWIVCAKRPLNTEELRQALVVEPGTCRLDKTNLSRQRYGVFFCRVGHR